MCERKFQKQHSLSLHMLKIHDIKDFQYTPMPVKHRRLFIYDESNTKKKTESELRVHKSTMHNRNKRNLSEMKRGPISRTISVKRSPPMKKN